MLLLARICGASTPLDVNLKPCARRDAKLAVLEWDGAADRLRTSSLHYFEGDAALAGGRKAFSAGPRAVCDPQVVLCSAIGTLISQL